MHHRPCNVFQPGYVLAKEMPQLPASQIWPLKSKKTGKAVGGGSKAKKKPKATAKKKAKVKKIDTKVKQIKKAKATVQKRKASVQKKKAAVKKAQKKKPVKKPSVTSAKKARASLKSRAKR